MEGGGGAAPPADTVMSDAAPHPEPHQPPAAAMGIDNIPATLSHGGRFIQYNIFGNIFEVTAKYKPPIMPIGKGAYGIVWYSLTLFFVLSLQIESDPKLVSFLMFFFSLYSFMCFLNVRKRWILFYLVGNGRRKFLFGFCFCGVWIARLWTRTRMSMLPSRRLRMLLTTRLTPRGPSEKSSCFVTWIMKTLVSNDWDCFMVLFVCFLAFLF